MFTKLCSMIMSIPNGSERVERVGWGCNYDCYNCDPSSIDNGNPFIAFSIPWSLYTSCSSHHSRFWSRKGAKQICLHSHDSLFMIGDRWQCVFCGRGSFLWSERGYERNIFGCCWHKTQKRYAHENSNEKRKIRASTIICIIIQRRRKILIS